MLDILSALMLAFVGYVAFRMYRWQLWRRRIDALHSAAGEAEARVLREYLETKEEPPMEKMFRQGDVLLIKVKGVPRHAKDVTAKDRIVLAYGEVTGHAHAFYPEVVTEGEKPALKAKLWDAGAERYLQVLEQTALRHEEHATIPIDKGVYRVVRQREYDPVRDRYVAD